MQLWFWFVGKLNDNEIQVELDSSSIIPSRNIIERLKTEHSLGKLLWGFTSFYFYKHTKLCDCAWQELEQELKLLDIILRNRENDCISNSSYPSAKKVQKPWEGFFLIAEWLRKFPFRLSFSVSYRHLNVWQIDYRLLVLRVFEKNEALISSILKDKHNIWSAQFTAPIKTFTKATVPKYCKDWCQYHSHYDHVFILLYIEKL